MITRSRKNNKLLKEKVDPSPVFASKIAPKKLRAINMTVNKEASATNINSSLSKKKKISLSEKADPSPVFASRLALKRMKYESSLSKKKKTSMSEKAESSPVLTSKLVPKRRKDRSVISSKETQAKNINSSLSKKKKASMSAKKPSTINHNKAELEKENIPVWKKEDMKASPVFQSLNSKIKRRSLRVSKIQNKDIYDFLVDEKNNQAKETTTKVKTKRKRAPTKKENVKKKINSGLLTTDPIWKPPIEEKTQNQFSATAFYNSTNMARNRFVSRRTKRSIPPSNSVFQYDDDETCWDFDIDDTGYEGGVSVASEHNSCLSEGGNTSVPHRPNLTNNFAGSTSTPKGLLLRKPPIEGNIENCFGFDEPEDEVAEFSPVEKASRSMVPGLQVSTSSTITIPDKINPPAPSRFTAATTYKRTSYAHNKKSKISGKDKSTYSRQRILKDITSQKQNLKSSVPNISNESNENHHKTVLFDCDVSAEMNKEISDEKYQKNLNPKSPQSKKATNNKMKMVISPEKSFHKPIRRSYDRAALEQARKKRLEMLAGGSPMTDTETEEDEVASPSKRNGRTIKSKMHPKPKATYKNKNKKSGSKLKEKSLENKSNPISSKKKKKIEQSLIDWASDINSHFSEIENVELVTE